MGSPQCSGGWAQVPWRPWLPPSDSGLLIGRVGDGLQCNPDEQAGGLNCRGARAPQGTRAPSSAAAVRGRYAIPAIASRTIQIPVRSCTCVWMRDDSPV